MSLGTGVCAVYTQHASPGKGIGLFANKNLSAGARILEEAPAVRAPKGAHPIEIYRQVKHLGQQSVMKLQQYATLTSSSSEPKLEGWFQLIADYLNSHPDIAFMEFPDIQRRKPVQRYAIFVNNCFEIEGEDDSVEQAVFLKAARLNHSCLPNCYASWNREYKLLRVYAVRDIQKGEELTIAYCPAKTMVEDLKIRKERLLRDCGFVCRCPACDEHTSLSRKIDAKRKEMASLPLESDIHLFPDPRKDLAPYELQGSLYQLQIEQGFGTWETGKA